MKIKKIGLFTIAASFCAVLASCGSTAGGLVPSTTTVPTTTDITTADNTATTDATTTTDTETKTNALTYSEYAAAAVGTEVTIEAYVQDKQSWWSNKGTFYLADRDGAYFVYELPCTQEEYNTLGEGTKVRVTGVKGAWEGEVEILGSEPGAEATWEIIADDTYVAPAKVITDNLSADLSKFINQKVTFNDLVVLSVSEKAANDDLYVEVTDGSAVLTFCVEAYLRGANTEVYKTVKELKNGDKVSLSGFLYWYREAQLHITDCTVSTNINEKSVGTLTYDQYTKTENGQEVTIEAYVQDKQSWWNNKGTFYLADTEGAYFVYELPCTKEQYDSLVEGTKVRVTGVKGAWAGEVEILGSEPGSEATWEIVSGQTYVAPAKNLTKYADDLEAYINQKAAFKGFTVLSVKEKAVNDDLYLKLVKDDVIIDFCVEAYLRGAETDVYKTVKSLNVGDVVDVDCFLYWYNGPNPHLINCVKTGVNKSVVKSEGVIGYLDYIATEDGQEVTIEAYVQDKQSWWNNKGTFYLADGVGAYFIYELPCTKEEYDTLVAGTKIKVTGVKGSWAGEVEILGSEPGSEATWEIVAGDTYIAAAKDLSKYAGDNDALANYKNQLATFKNLEVVSVKEKAANDDLYLELKSGEKTFIFCVEAYLRDANTDVYKFVKSLVAGDIVNVTGFLYWYEGANTHIISAEKVSK